MGCFSCSLFKSSSTAELALDVIAEAVVVAVVVVVVDSDIDACVGTHDVFGVKVHTGECKDEEEALIHTEVVNEEEDDNEIISEELCTFDTSRRLVFDGTQTIVVLIVFVVGFI